MLVVEESAPGSESPRGLFVERRSVGGSARRSMVVVAKWVKHRVWGQQLELESEVPRKPQLVLRRNFHHMNLQQIRNTSAT